MLCTSYLSFLSGDLLDPRHEPNESGNAAIGTCVRVQTTVRSVLHQSGPGGFRPAQESARRR